MPALLKVIFFILSATSAFANTLQSFINGKSAVMFSSTKCPWCDKAKDLLKSQGIEYELVELDTLPQNKRDFVFEELVAMTKQKTVPNIFLKGQHVGGYDSISKLHQGNLLKNFAQPKNNNNDK